MIVGINGYGNSGSSAIIDYLKGFDNVCVYDPSILHSEFQIIHEADGINDLKYHLVNSRERVACNAAIKRFSRLLENGRWGKSMKKILRENYVKWKDDYLNELIQVSWKGINSWYDPQDIRNDSRYDSIRLFQRMTNKIVSSLNSSWNCPPKQVKYFSFFSEDNFNSITIKYLKSLFGMLHFDNSKINIVDQIFSSTNPSLGMEFIPDSKCIIVIRDPRDIYVTAKIHPKECRYMPNDDVESYIKYYRSINESLKALDNKICLIKYEDMIYKYTKTTEIIREYLDLQTKPNKEFVYFNPIFSSQYTHRTAMYKQYPSEINKIESCLESFLYDFNTAIHPKDDASLRYAVEKTVYKGPRY